jgi:hypothetical protein
VSPDVKIDVTEKRTKWDQLLVRAHGLARAHVKVGVLASKRGSETHSGDAGHITLMELAAIHEFGSPAASIPERSFIRATFYVRRVEELRRKCAQIAKAVVTQGMDAQRALGLLGAWAVAEVKNTITEIDIPPPLADSTVQAKGSSKPLVDTGQLKNSIQYEVVDE